MAAPSASETQNIKIDTLKAEGDAFFCQKRFREAHSKYSEAIDLDGNIVVLYNNRAASALSMNEYLDAASDAKAAVKLDPLYSKAWARLGKAEHALGGYSASISAFNKAISLLPPELSATEKTLKKQYQEGIATAQETHNSLLQQSNESHARSAPAREIKLDSNILPWNRASTLLLGAIPRLSYDCNSSAWVIFTAHKDFKQGVEIMQQQSKSKVDSDGWTSFTGKPGALSAISNGILRDPRVFYMDDVHKWFEMYDRQVTMESGLRKVWSEGGASKVKKEAVERLQAAGWKDAAPALRMTVCGWFIRAFVSADVCRQFVTAIEMYRQAVEILQWGREKWKDVSSEERGSMFELTYIRGVKRMYMTTLVEAYEAYGKSNSQFRLQDAVELANDIIADVKSNPPAENIEGSSDWGFLLSFWAYPVGDAHAVLGYYHMQTGLRPGAGATKARNHFAKAAIHYLKAADSFAKDDEKHPYFLSIAVKAYWHRGTALRLTLPLCERVREGLAKSAYIWGCWAEQDRGCIDHSLQFQEHWTKQVADGKVTLDYEAKPAWMP